MKFKNVLLAVLVVFSVVTVLPSVSAQETATETGTVTFQFVDASGESVSGEYDVVLSPDGESGSTTYAGMVSGDSVSGLEFGDYTIDIIEASTGDVVYSHGMWSVFHSAQSSSFVVSDDGAITEYPSTATAEPVVVGGGSGSGSGSSDAVVVALGITLVSGLAGALFVFGRIK